MPSTNYVVVDTPSDDLRIVAAMTEELEDHLVDNEVYRTISIPGNGERTYQMSLGDLLSRFNRLHTSREELSEAEKVQLDGVVTKYEKTMHELRTRFRELLEREVKARANSLTWFLDDCQDDRERCRREFPFEMRDRQRIEEILKELGSDAAADLTRQVASLDERIRSMTQETDFSWQSKLQTLYPREPYWYLYVLPR